MQRICYVTHSTGNLFFPVTGLCTSYWGYGQRNDLDPSNIAAAQMYWLLSLSVAEIEIDGEAVTEMFMCNRIWQGFSKDDETKILSTNSYTKLEKNVSIIIESLWHCNELLHVWSSIHKHKELIFLSCNPII